VSRRISERAAAKKFLRNRCERKDSVREKGFGVRERIRCAVDAGDQRSMRVLLSRLKKVGK
jgi:hypothetical protein